MKFLLGKYVMLFAITSGFVFLSLFGLSLGMSTQSNGKMSDCPFGNNTASICTMSPLEHIAAWQSFFSTLPLKEKMSLIFSLVAFALALFLLPKFFQQFLKYNNLFYLQRYRYLRKDFIPNPLQELFSSGILNPKIF